MTTQPQNGLDILLSSNSSEPQTTTSATGEGAPEPTTDSVDQGALVPASPPKKKYWKRSGGIYKPHPDSPGIARISKLSHRHHFVIYLAAHGLLKKEIAKRTGFDKTWVSAMLRTPIIKDELARVRKDMFGKSDKERLKGMASKAVTILDKMLDDVDLKAGLKADVAFKTLDRVYGRPTQKIDHQGSMVRDLFEGLSKLRNVLKDEALEDKKGKEPIEVKSVSLKNNETYSYDKGELDKKMDDNVDKFLKESLNG